MVPKSFCLLGHKIRVRVVPSKRWKWKDCVGYWDPRKHVIYLHASQNKTALQHTFCHEMVHRILDAMSHQLSGDEKFVDTFAGLLHQAWTTIPSRDAE